MALSIVCNIVNRIQGIFQAPQENGPLNEPRGIQSAPILKAIFLATVCYYGRKTFCYFRDQNHEAAWYNICAIKRQCDYFREHYFDLHTEICTYSEQVDDTSLLPSFCFDQSISEESISHIPQNQHQLLLNAKKAKAACDRFQMQKKRYENSISSNDLCCNQDHYYAYQVDGFDQCK